MARPYYYPTGVDAQQPKSISDLRAQQFKTDIEKDKLSGTALFNYMLSKIDLTTYCQQLSRDSFPFYQFLLDNIYKFDPFCDLYALAEMK